MNQTFAVWVVIGLSLVTANLPFVVQRPFLVLPWTQAGEAPQPFWLQWPMSALFFALLAGAGYLAWVLIGQGFFVASDLASVALFLGKVLFVMGAAALLLAYPGWRNRGRVISKTFLDRLLELLAFYGLVGTLGFALEANVGNTFSHTWEFYAVTLSLFVVLGYPGFVYRYLMRHRKPRAAASPSARG
ncbi:MAG: DUF2818 family protein [Candidimonas sp.]|nr:DUF2818 family protein [Candidimonas sp.]